MLCTISLLLLVGLPFSPSFLSLFFSFFEDSDVFFGPFMSFFCFFSLLGVFCLPFCSCFLHFLILGEFGGFNLIFSRGGSGGLTGLFLFGGDFVLLYFAILPASQEVVF